MGRLSVIAMEAISGYWDAITKLDKILHGFIRAFSIYLLHFPTKDFVPSNQEDKEWLGDFLIQMASYEEMIGNIEDKLKKTDDIVGARLPQFVESQ
jgi:hypothetical protein